ncbi:thiamine biosynthesis lipoprotein [Volucribacter psittacicida]|uniref:FAD:protein FMN transferase n=1 Tax=Volucribacter psittacicida TaxID=203482 RepID=A0A4R1FJ51_9PAST|nr:thiamine biosynthesis lipoprotein [Volucribacter psittacicida]
MFKKFVCGLTAIAFVFVLVACEKQPKIINLTGKTMGTTYHIKYIDRGEVKLSAEQLQAQVEQQLHLVNQQMSTYIADSEISQFNQSQNVNQPMPISAAFATVVAEAIQLNQLTQGGLDITVGPLVNLWGFGPEHRPDKQPTPEQIEQRRAWIGLDKLQLTQQAEQAYLTKTVPQLYIDLSSIAKGYGVDLVADTLEQNAIVNYMVEIGGEIRAKGKNIEEKSWQIAIEKPTNIGERSPQLVIGLENMAMATSGDYRIYFEENGQRFSHEIDPTTGYPIQHNLASITVLNPSAMTADGLSTGLFVLGADKALEIAEQQGLAIYLIMKQGDHFESKMSSEFKRLTGINE